VQKGCDHLRASYERSLWLSRRAKELHQDGYVRSGILVDVGEEMPDMAQVMRGLHDVRSSYRIAETLSQASGEPGSTAPIRTNADAV
jgi:lipoate synthase